MSLNKKKNIAFLNYNTIQEHIGENNNSMPGLPRPTDYHSQYNQASIQAYKKSYFDVKKDKIKFIPGPANIFFNSDIGINNPKNKGRNQT